MPGQWPAGIVARQRPGAVDHLVGAELLQRLVQAVQQLPAGPNDGAQRCVDPQLQLCEPALLRRSRVDCRRSRRPRQLVGWDLAVGHRHDNLAERVQCWGVLRGVIGSEAVEGVARRQHRHVPSQASATLIFMPVENSSGITTASTIL